MIILLILMLSSFGHEHTQKENKNEWAGNLVATTIVCEDAEVENPVPSENVAGSGNWELRKHDDDVCIYQRWVEVGAGRKARELYAEILVKSTPEKLAQVIRNEKYGTEWLSMADEYTVLRENSELEWYAYSRFNFLPALKFDLVTRNEMKLNPENHAITIGISGQPNYLPENEKYRRLSHFEGKWEFVLTENNCSRIRYYMFSKTKPFLPRWITDPFVFNEMENCISNVKKIAERL